MITSERKFGVEIEFYCDTKAQQKRISDRINLVEDGSIRHVPYSAEYVSPILQGSDGEKEIQNACEIIKKNGGRAENIAMSVHVHMDGKIDNNEMFESVEKPSSYKLMFRISNKLLKHMGEGSLLKLLENRTMLSDEIEQTVFEGVTHLSFSKLKTLPVNNFTYIYVKDSDRFNWLRNMMYFYTQYSQVMEDIVSTSRRFGNMYCIPLGDSFDLPDIEAVKNEEELLKLWYKETDTGGHYNDSRYHNVNFHSYWDRTGTIEIRSHGGTIDPNKILLWVKLHQKIADKLEDLTLDKVKATNSNLHLSFLEFIEEPLLQNYVKRLMGYYSGIKIR